MASIFSKNMYKVFDDKSAVICFTRTSLDKLFVLRDKMSELILQKIKLYVYKTEGKPLPIDSWIRFFNISEKEQIETFKKMQRPNILIIIFNAKPWRQYKKQKELINKLMLFDMETSHEFPCLAINKNNIFSKNELIEIIEKAAKIINLEIYYNNKFLNIHSVVW